MSPVNAGPAPALLFLGQSGARAVDGLSDLNLTHPDHLGNDPVSVGRRMRDCGVQLSGLAMRCCTNPA